MPTVQDIMSNNLITLRPGASLREAAKLFESRKISGAPVVDEEGVIVGVVTKTDLTWARATGDSLVDLFYQGLIDWERSEDLLDQEYQPYSGGAYEDEQLDELRVSDVMNSTVFSVHQKASLKEAAQKMIDERIHRLVVTNGEAFVGMVSTTDFLRHTVETH